MADRRSRGRIPADDPKTSIVDFTRGQRERDIAELVKKTGCTRARVIEEFTERAAIREYVGGMPRPVAEARALADVESILGQQKLNLQGARGARYVPDGDGYW